MGQHIRNGVLYGGATSFVKPITETEYNNLSTEEKMRNVVYAMPSDTMIEADAVRYNTTNVAAELTTINRNLNGFKIVGITQTAYDSLTTKDASTIYLING